MKLNVGNLDPGDIIKFKNEKGVDHLLLRVVKLMVSHDLALLTLAYPGKKIITMATDARLEVEILGSKNL